MSQLLWNRFLNYNKDILSDFLSWKFVVKTVSREIEKALCQVKALQSNIISALNGKQEQNPLLHRGPSQVNPSIPSNLYLLMDQNLLESTSSKVQKTSSFREVPCPPLWGFSGLNICPIILGTSWENRYPIRSFCKVLALQSNLEFNRIIQDGL